LDSIKARRFLEKTKLFTTSDARILEKNMQLVTLLEAYIITKNQLLKGKSIKEIRQFNKNVYQLLIVTDNYRDHLEKSLNANNDDYAV
jgi:hypothetical protein